MERKTRRVGGWIGGVVVLTLGWACGTATYRESVSQSQPEAQVAAPVSQEPAPSFSAPTQPILAQAPLPHQFSLGEALYLRHCAGCHGWEGKGGGPVGEVLLKKPPSLRRPELFAQNTEAELVARILLGKDLPMSLTSEAVQATEREVSALLAHVRRLPTISWKDVLAGQKVYDTLCVSCHGIYGRGDGLMAPALSPRPRDLTDPGYQQQVSDDALFRLISEGKGGMPGTSEILSEGERRAVVAFVRLLTPGYETYDRFCAVCHGASGIPPESIQKDLLGALLGQETVETKTPVFSKKYMQTHDDKHLRTWVGHMLKQHRAVMPHFGGELTAEEVRLILGYVRALPPQP